MKAESTDPKTGQLDPNAISKKGAQGLMQLMPGTAKDMGVTDRTDPKQNIEGGAKYLKDLLTDKWTKEPFIKGDMEKALAAYNWGIGHLQECIKNWGEDWKNHLPTETKNYLKKLGY